MMRRSHSANAPTALVEVSSPCLMQEQTDFFIM
jgi:hypothetical protein